MSRKPNDTTAEQKSGAEQSGKARSTAARTRVKKKTIVPADEETPITVSNGSIQIRSALDREDTGGKKHKHCKVGDIPGKKWALDRVEIYDDDGIRTLPIVGGEAAFVMVWFKRPL
jgi:hypothetical protein